MFARLRDLPVEDYSLPINMAPMIDVVMCLIIFFMILADFDHLVLPRLTLPYASEAAEPNHTLHELARGVPTLTLSVFSDHVEIAGQRFSLKEGARESFEQRLLLENFETGKEYKFKGCGWLKSELRVLIRGGGAIPFSVIQSVLKSCQNAYIHKTSFQATKRCPSALGECHEPGR